jgi:uncharacterized protein YkwD
MTGLDTPATAKPASRVPLPSTVSTAARPLTRPAATSRPSVTSRPASKSSTPRPAPTRPPSTTLAAPAPLSGAPGIAQSVLAALNASRTDAGLAPLRWNPALQRSAHQHNLAMSAANSLSHQLPGEPAFGERESAQGVRWASAAENIGWTSEQSTAGALSIESSMFGESPPNDGHRQNILSDQTNSIGIDVVLDAAHGRLWLTEDFAKV